MLKKFFLCFFTFLSTVLFAAEFVVVQTTDIHGNLSAENEKRPGLLHIAGIIRKARMEAGRDNFLLIDCGDLTQGTSQAAMDHGMVMIDAVNALEYDVWVPGNHDFDCGVSHLLDLIRHFKGTVLAANLQFDGGNPANVKPWKMFRKAGKNIAVIGCVPPYLDQWIGEAQLKGCSVIPPEDAIEKYMPEIKNASPDMILLAIHSGKFISARLNRDNKRKAISHLTSRFPAIRLVLGGHSHETVPAWKLYPAGLFVQAPALGDGLAVIRVTLNEDINCTPQIVSSAGQPPDEALVKTLKSRKDAGKQKKLARVPFLLEPSKGRGTPSALAEIFARAMMETSGAQGAFSGTLSHYRNDANRPLRDREIFLLAPYENFISVLTLTEAQFRDIVTEQNNLKFKDSYMFFHGTAPKPGGTAEIAFSSYALSGAGGRFPVLRKTGREAPRRDLDITIRQAFRSYLLKHYPMKENKR